MLASHVSAAIALTFVLGQAAPPPLQHPHEAGQPPPQLGTVEFETSCDPALRADINRAVALLHSFWFGAFSRRQRGGVHRAAGSVRNHQQQANNDPVGKQ